MDFVYPMQKFREWQKIQSLEKHSIMLDFKLFNLFWNIENLAPPPSKKCSSLEKNVDPSQKSAWNMSFSTHIFFHFQPIKDSFEVSLDIEISIVFEIKSKFFKIDRSQCFSKIHIPVHCRSNFEKPLFFGGRVQTFWKTWIWISSLIEISISTEISNEA